MVLGILERERTGAKGRGTSQASPPPPLNETLVLVCKTHVPHDTEKLVMDPETKPVVECEHEYVHVSVC